MKYTLHREPDYLIESFNALTAIYQQDGPAQAIASIAAKNEGRIGEEMLRPLLGPSAALIERIAAQVELAGEEAELLFCRREDADTFAAIVLAHELFVRNGADDPMRAIIQLIREEGDDAQPPRDGGEEDFFSWVDRLNMPAASKYDLLKLLHDFERYRRYALDKARIAQQIIRDSLPDFAALIDDLHATLQKGLAQQGADFLHEHLRVRLDGAAHYDIYPSLALPNAGSFFIFEDVGIRQILVGVGILPICAFYKELDSRGEGYSAFLKALSDGTKLQILLMLRQRPHYNGELAEALGLTSPTISHHMNALAGLGIVTLEKVGNRVYYTLSRDSIRERLKSLEKTLCG